MWTKTGDEYPDERLDLSDAAYRLEHAALTYCNRLLLDGLLPKSRLGLIAVPPRTRAPKVVTELLRAGRWLDDSDAYVLVGFLKNQPSGEEVEAKRAYDAIRQRLRFERSPEGKSAIKAEEEAAKQVLFEARQRRRAAAASQRDMGSTSQRESQRESQRPVPSRPRPAPPRPNEGEGTRGKGRVGSSIVDTAPAGGLAVSATAILNDPQASDEAKAGAATMLSLAEKFKDEDRNGTPSESVIPPARHRDREGAAEHPCSTCGHGMVEARPGRYVCTNAPGHLVGARS
jgi:hypothetical protein